MREARRPPNWLVLAVVSFGVFVAADDLTVVTTMLRPMVADFGITLPDGVDEAAWIVDAYLIAYVSVMPIAGRLSDVVGRRRVYLAALVIFLVGSIIVPITDSYGVLLLGRVLTALGGGALVPVGIAVVGDLYEGRKRSPALGVLGAVDTLGWVWGPLFGAMLIRYLDWQWQFYLNIPLGLFGIAAAWWALAGHDVRRPISIDWRGAAALTVGLAALNIGLLESAEIQSVAGLEELTGTRRSLTVPMLVLAAVAIVAFVRWERRSSSPVIDLGLFRARGFAASMGVNFLLGASLVIAMVNVPLFVNVVRRETVESALVSGRVLSALTVTMAVFALVGGRLGATAGYRAVTAVGMAVAAAAFGVMGGSWDPAVSEGAMAWQLAALGVGFGLATAPTQAAAVDAAPDDRRGSAAGLVLVFRLLGLSVGLAGLTAWGLARFNALRPSLQLPPIGSPGYEEALAQGQAELTSTALSETFVAAALVAAAAVAVAWALQGRRRADTEITAPGVASRRITKEQGTAPGDD